MEVFILTAGYYDGIDYIAAFSTIEKAVLYCEEEFGISPGDWIVSGKTDSRFYDPTEKKELKTHYTDFVIYTKPLI